MAVCLGCWKGFIKKLIFKQIKLKGDKEVSCEMELTMQISGAVASQAYGKTAKTLMQDFSWCIQGSQCDCSRMQIGKSKRT